MLCPGLSRRRRVLVSAAVAWCAAGCSTPSALCPDLSGTYADRSENGDMHLSRVFLGPSGPASATRVRLTWAPGRLTVAPAGQRVAVLTAGKDFACHGDDLALARVDEETVGLPEVLLATRRIRYVLSRSGDGGLTADVRVKAQTSAAGITLPAPEHSTDRLRWRRSPSP